jgi:hypothetical protein
VVALRAVKFQRPPATEHAAKASEPRGQRCAFASFATAVGTAGTNPILPLPGSFGHIVAAMLVGSPKKSGAFAKIEQTPTAGLADLCDAHRDDCAGGRGTMLR